jgi:hypothetical protein
MAEDQEKDTTEQEDVSPFITEDSTISGILIAKDHKVIPKTDERRRVQYYIYGDVKKSLQEIYENAPVGSLDVLNGIKSARAMIFTLRGRNG